MKHELAKTLTLALVNYIDENRSEGTMDCSSGECVSLEKAFTEENFDSVETLINKKLSRLSEFEKCILDFAKERDEYEFDSTKVVELNNKVIKLTKSYAKKLLALAKKELLKDDELGKKHLEGYIMGREETMREMNDFLKSHFNSEEAKAPNPPAINIPTWTPPCYNGGPCTNPFHDCINCPRTNVVISPNTSSGTSTSKAEG